jgi:hypothetical protein
MCQSLLDRKPHYRRVVEFENGYAASVICNEHSYGGHSGRFEVAVLKDGDLCYDTPITNDVIGYCDFQQVADLLLRIADLPDWRHSVQA